MRQMGPLLLPLGFGFALLLVFAASRFALAALHRGSIADVPRWGMAFVHGLRIDLSTACYLAAPLLLLALALRGRARRWLRPLVVGYAAAVFGIAVALEVVTPSHIEEYGGRPGRLFVQAENHTVELYRTLLTAYTVQLVLLVAIVSGAVWLAVWAARRAWDGGADWSWGGRLLALLLAAPLVFLGARGTLNHRPLNASCAAFSNDYLCNQLGLNSLYSAAFALYSAKDECPPARFYGDMDELEMIQRVQRAAGMPEGKAQAPDGDFVHSQAKRLQLPRPRNLVILLEESLGAAWTGVLGGSELTPEFDKLCGDGVLLTQLYATGTRTVRGIEAVVSGFLPTPGRSVVKLPGSQRDFFTVAALLKEHGYATDFVYGGESHFDNMRSFFLGNGFDVALDQNQFERAEFRGTWGVGDVDLMREANRRFAEHADKPFLGLVLTTSNHSPFEFPEGALGGRGPKPGTREGAVAYADLAIGEFFRLARREAYFENTVFLVVADHDTRAFGADLVPLERFHIPGLLLAPGLAPAKLDTLASQVDLMPTALGLMGLDTRHPMIGRDLLDPAAGRPGRAVLQYEDQHVYWVGDRLVVHRPGKRVQQFGLGGGALREETVDGEFARDGLAHALLPFWLYDRGAYAHVPAAGTPVDGTTPLARTVGR